MSDLNTKDLNWGKVDGLMPAIIQDDKSGSVLMLGYMNKEALNATLTSGKVTFFSRTKDRLWVKGETSGNFLKLISIAKDCDNDAILVQANPLGPTCHLNSKSCFSNDDLPTGIEFISYLSELIEDRHNKMPKGSYTTKLFTNGVDRIAQKVGEEAIETVIASKNSEDAPFLNESADLLYHLIVLLRNRGLDIFDVIEVLRGRHQK